MAEKKKKPPIRKERGASTQNQAKEYHRGRLPCQ
nr:MAG TPA: hypothetical protein [Caudoviricetes sp.]